MAFDSSKSALQLVYEGAWFYGRHIGRLTQPFIVPVVLQVLGVGLWLYLAYQSINWMLHIPVHLHPWLIWIIFFAANIPGVLIFMRGFWGYLVWMAAVNLLVRDLADTGTSQENAAYILRVQHRATDYSILWLILFAISCIPLVFAILPTPWLPLTHLTTLGWAWIGLFCFLGVLVMGMVMYTGTFIFQTFVFAPGPSSLIWGRSWSAVKKAPFKTLFLGGLALLMVQLVLPSILLCLADIMHVSQLAGAGLTYPVQYVADQTLSSLYVFEAKMPAVVHLFQILFRHPAALALEIAQSLMLTIIAAFLLPLGSCWLTFLYLQLAETGV